MLILEVLGQAAHQVDHAADGAEAIALLRQAGSRFDLALLDMVMPDVDGVAVMAVCRAEFPGMPVILTSGYAERVVQQRTRGLLPDAYLAKPWRAQTLLDLVAQLLSSHPGPFTGRS